jgi:hypothetical protein
VVEGKGQPHSSSCPATASDSPCVLGPFLLQSFGFFTVYLSGPLSYVEQEAKYLVGRSHSDGIWASEKCLGSGDRERAMGYHRNRADIRARKTQVQSMVLSLYSLL